MKPTSQIDQIKERLRQAGFVQSTKASEAKAERTKPMTSRTTKNNTGLEAYTNSQLTATLDKSNTMQEVYRCHLELQNRLQKYRETLGHIALEVLNRLEVEYQKYNPNGFESEAEFYETEPNPFSPPPPPPPASLTWEIYQSIEADICPHGPYIMEIYESDWDYIDRRPNNIHMQADQWKAKDWVLSHRSDFGKISDLSEQQAKFMLVLLKAYYYHKTHPYAQAAANNGPPPPF
jgi:hypothetical protein